jgi:ferrochelatase
MKTGVIFINFGEPPQPTAETVTPFLERIFLQNMDLEHARDPDAVRARARKLATDRAPDLIEEYRAIGGSPLNAQADAQAARLEGELRRRGHDATVYSCFQFLQPFIADAVRRAREEGMERIVGLPVYPLCGQSTNVVALRDLRACVEAEADWDPELLEIGGWHGHPDYLDFHADHVRDWCAGAGVDPAAEGTALLFSIHGTPLKYLEEGNRYDRYVDEVCAGLARRLGVARYHMGYQNHSNRPVDWTQPDVDGVVAEIDAERVVVVAVSFMHEQSETLSELDHELREEAEEAGLEFFRVPIPHDSPRFDRILADLVEGRASGDPHGGGVVWRRCFCRGGGLAHCTNGLRLDPHVTVAAG